jgi:hypothetical protein
MPTMAYVVPRTGGTWELRESRVTARGPRSYTLAGFRVLTPEVLERAKERASGAVDAEDLRRAAVRAGAPVALSTPDRAAGELLTELAHGRRPRGALRRLLLAALEDEHAGSSADSARSAGAWVATTPAQRGEALRDLLLLSDRLPAGRGRGRLRFPRIHTTATV